MVLPPNEVLLCERYSPCCLGSVQYIYHLLILVSRGVHSTRTGFDTQLDDTNLRNVQNRKRPQISLFLFLPSFPDFSFCPLVLLQK